MADQAALAAAAKASPVIPLFVRAWPAGTAALGDLSVPGGASRWWLSKSLASLDNSLRELGSRLTLRSGDPVAVIEALIEQTGASAVHFQRHYEPDDRVTEERLRTMLASRSVAAKRYCGGLLFEPDEIKTGSGTPFKVYSPFARACFSAPPPKPAQPVPSSLASPAAWPSSERLDDWGLHPTRPDWSGGLAEAWDPGEAGAEVLLSAFLDGPVRDYSEQRDRPDIAATSRLSPHLHFGEISIRSVWQRTQLAAAADPKLARGAEKFLKELLWREFSAHLLCQFEALPSAPFRPEFARFPWAKDQSAYEAWTKGQTGYPVVDAGMRELWQTGIMHNRVRMVVASFLIKHLLIPWQRGEAWFHDTLVDADLANNAASWQWVAGSGADAAPYFRIFNPVTQGQKFDPDGNYVRRYVPELAKLPAPDIHAPWLSAPAVLAAAGVLLGSTYPAPIVDHAFARERALAALAAIKIDASTNA